MDIKSFVYCAQHLPSNISVLIRGNHGIGKSQVVGQLATTFGLSLIDKRLSQLSEGDMIGLPKLEGDTTRFCHPDWYVQACEQPTMLFFDELNRALPEVMQAAFQIVLDRELNGRKLHPGTRVFAAVNSDSMYQVNEMDPALLDRFWIVDLEPTAEDWIEWAKTTGNINQDLIDFITVNKTVLEPSKKANVGDKQPSRRSWHRYDQVAKTMGLYNADFKTDGAKANELFQIGLGFVGSVCAQNFVDFLKNIDRQVTAEDIINNWKKNEKKVLGLGQEKWNICIEKVAGWCRDNVLTEKQAKNVGMFAEKLPGELVVHLWTELAKDPNAQTQPNIKSVHPWLGPLILKVFNKDDKTAPAAK